MLSEERVLVALSTIRHIRMNRPPATNFCLACDIRKITSVPLVLCPLLSSAPTVNCLTMYIFCFSYHEILISPEFVIDIMTLFKGLI